MGQSKRPTWAVSSHSRAHGWANLTFLFACLLTLAVPLVESNNSDSVWPLVRTTGAALSGGHKVSNWLRLGRDELLPDISQRRKPTRPVPQSSIDAKPIPPNEGIKDSCEKEEIANPTPIPPNEGIKDSCEKGEIADATSIPPNEGIKDSCEKEEIAEREHDANPIFQHPSFSVVKTGIVEALSMKIVLYRHKKLGLKLLSFSPLPSNETKVPNDVRFSIGFGTPALKANGVAHIWKRAVFHGSRKYPMRNPFQELRQSASTFTTKSVSTTNSYTIYHLASNSQIDLNNLIDIQLDGVFFPLAKHDEDVFKQEGWRYVIKRNSLNNIANMSAVHDDPRYFAVEPQSSPIPGFHLDFSGEHQNHMRQNYLDPIFQTRLLNSQMVFEQTIDVLDCGGSPSEIPKLNFQSFVEFHDKFYHPANARVVCWGPDGAKPFLNKIDSFMEDWLAAHAKANNGVEQVVDAEAIWRSTKVARQNVKLGRQHLVHPFPCKKGQVEDIISIAFIGNRAYLGGLMNSKYHQNFTLAEYEILEETARSVFGILQEILLSPNTGILYRNLLQSGIGTKIFLTPITTSNQYDTLIIGMSHATPKEGVENTLESVVVSTIEEILNNGIPKESLEQAFNNVEFRQQQRNIQQIITSTLKLMFADKFPVDALNHTKYHKLKKMLADGVPVLELALKMLLADWSRAVSRLKCTLGYVYPHQEEVAQLLATEQAKMTVADFERIDAEDKALIAKMKTPATPEALATLPTMNLEDIKLEVNVTQPHAVITH
eukprot:GHVT01030898.1.p1 GENE.GHVT01030898.1~~GHVT01030898.1.p1  ORF type:complete len:770 (+),score=74.51 GHVT01030898.1:4055-6364(+)